MDKECEDLGTGTVLFFPERNWAIKEMTLNLNRGGDPFVNTFTFTHGEKKGEPYQVKYAESKLYFNPDDRLKFVSWDYEIRNVEVDKTPKAEFYLKYYGLKELKIAGSNIGWFRGALIAVGVLVIAAGAFRIIRRKGSMSGSGL